MATGERPETCLPCGVERDARSSLVGHGRARADGSVGDGTGAAS